MALVKAPLLSLDASGALGNALVFSKWKGRPYVRSLVKPANPKSGGQVGVRAAFKFLSQHWGDGGASAQATWEDLAEQDVVSGFNAYMKQNLLRNRNFLAPGQEYPALVAQTASAIDTFAATAGERQITITINDDTLDDVNWGFLIFRALSTGFTPAFDNLVAIVEADGANVQSWVDTPLVPDTYYYDAKPFTVDASLGALKGEINGVVA